MTHLPLKYAVEHARRASEDRLVRKHQRERRQLDALLMETSSMCQRNPRRHFLVPEWRQAAWRHATCRNATWLDKGYGPYCPRKGGRYNFLPSRAIRDKGFLASRKSMAWLMAIPTASRAFPQ